MLAWYGVGLLNHTSMVNGYKCLEKLCSICLPGPVGKSGYSTKTGS